MKNWDKFGNLSILIIDDDLFTRELIKTMFNKISNVTVHQALDGIEALGVMTDLKLDMIFLDLYMPHIDGKAFISNIRKNDIFLNVPITLMTTDRLSQMELKEIGADYYLTKPFDFHNFLDTVHLFLEKNTVSNET